MRKMCYASRLRKRTIRRLKFSKKKHIPNIFFSPKTLIRMESLCWQSVFLLLSHLSTSVVSFDKHCRLLIQKFQQFIFSCESGIWLHGTSQEENKNILKISEKVMRHNEISLNQYRVEGFSANQNIHNRPWCPMSKVFIWKCKICVCCRARRLPWLRRIMRTLPGLLLLLSGERKRLILSGETRNLEIYKSNRLIRLTLPLWGKNILR